jgi:hypothetical protein
MRLHVVELAHGAWQRTSRLRNFEVTTDLASEKIIDFPVTGHCRCFAGRAIHVNGVSAAFSEQHASVPF